MVVALPSTPATVPSNSSGARLFSFCRDDLCGDGLGAASIGREGALAVHGLCGSFRLLLRALLAVMGGSRLSLGLVRQATATPCVIKQRSRVTRV